MDNDNYKNFENLFRRNTGMKTTQEEEEERKRRLKENALKRIVNPKQPQPISNEE